MRCIVLASKHHDGFCLWDTKLTDYNNMNTPLKRDLVGSASGIQPAQEILSTFQLQNSLFYS